MMSCQRMEKSFLSEKTEFILHPVGLFRCKRLQHKYEASRQGVFSKAGTGVIDLFSGLGYENALKDLDGFERIWVLYIFNRNDNGHWKPIVSPPVTANEAKIGMFATRCPYRPNPIGLSCVRLVGVSGLTVTVDEADMLDGTPVIDIKPYITAADAFPNAKCGWVENQNPLIFSVHSSPVFQRKSNKILMFGGMDLQAVAEAQLRTKPTSSERKRVRKYCIGWILSIRLYRILFSVDDKGKTVELIDILSGYSPEQIENGGPDKYGDLHIHISSGLRSL